MLRRRFVLLDRDGTLIQEKIYLSDPAGVELTRKAASALRDLQALGLGLAVVTNQAGIGRGFFTSAELNAVHRRLIGLLANEGVRLDGIYVCAHAPEDGCMCRKPKLGLFERALAEHSFDSSKSFMIGDKAIDIEFGRAAGATAILVRTGYGAEVERGGRAQPHHIVDDLPAAARLIQNIIKLEN
ncbi:MAG: HAD family hydrolase [Candidatus Sungbacteria bacterium]|uniref:D,D-heptose 1,7-bisphosphate phosphatase n=1 Tax=Candidatus Sungiibacteriota bacterium TaxID=2750080 RepID=A0A932YY50_9BACT|nr:HAD family hydrolase [Candidatus Sungbacteria bacterium]